jgi:hypothetical protein
MPELTPEPELEPDSSGGEEKKDQKCLFMIINYYY